MLRLFSRIFCVVLDGVGVGEAPDAADYGDVGSNSLGNTARAVGGLRLPNLERMGLGNVCDIPG
ncbi:MAG: phosphopentomutase, partial [Candidatus Krumholzibacteria bacterium]|nr:phosphopentomutase [Candidatus Krumholzibacteria bacterium]